MKRIVFLVCCLGLFWMQGHGQRKVTLNDDKAVEIFNDIPIENVLVHYNSSLLFAGSYLYYSFYSLQEDNKTSEISKIGYIELINEQYESVLKQKVRLREGRGQGDWFIPTSLPSGNYKLIGYTQLLLNFDQQHYFQSNISIINPYLGNQKSILKPKTSNQPSETIKEPLPVASTNSKIADQQQYTTRAKVTLVLTEKELPKGTYSISVRKKDTLQKAAKTWLIDDTKHTSRKQYQKNDTVFVPELRGATIQGKLVAKEKDFLIAKRRLAISTPNTDQDFKIIKTNDQGAFAYTQSIETYPEQMIMEVLEAESKAYEIVMDTYPKTRFQDLDFFDFYINSSHREWIEEQSIYNQIEHSFFSVKPDTLQQAPLQAPLHQGLEITYELDEYTRFPTVRKTIMEVVDQVWLKRLKNGKYSFAIRGYGSDHDITKYPVGVLVDGIFATNHNQVLNYNANLVKSISYVRDRYYNGSMIFDGLISIQTKEKDFWDLINTTNSKRVILENLRGNKKYFCQQYSADDDYARIPDYRCQLLWKPDYNMTQSKQAIHFYTSDVTGDFEIEIQGISNDSKAIAIKRQIQVVPSDI